MIMMLKVECFTGNRIKVTVSCDTPNQVGSYTGDLFFHLLHEDKTSGFLVLRYIRFYKANEIMDMLMPKAPYQKPKKVPDIWKDEIIPGIKPSLYVKLKLNNF